MANVNWPRDLFGVDLNRTMPDSHQVIGGVNTRTPSLIILPDSGGGGGGQYPDPVIISVGGTYLVSAALLSDLLLDADADVTIQLPSSLLRGNGNYVTISDIGGFLTAHPATVLPFRTEPILGESSISLTTPFMGISFYPITTGSGGWYTK